MSDDGIEWDGEELSERPFGGRPFGGRPFGGRPFGGKPFGGKPFGGKPFGGKPFGGKPFGGKPFGGKPFGGRPFGGRPFGGRFADDEYGFFGPDDWSAGIAQALCEGSAVIRLGATIVATDDQLWIPWAAPSFGFRPGPAVPGVDPPAGPPPPPRLELRPSDHVLEARVAVRDMLLDRVEQQPELGDAIKIELGEGLSRAADGAFLAPGGPLGAISDRAGIQVAAAPAAGPSLLGTLRAVVLTVFGQTPRPAFRSPGWVLHPLLLDRVARIRTVNGEDQSSSTDARSLASFGLLQLVTVDQGMLLGFPFATSSEATNGAGQPRIYFGADWQEAYIGTSPSFVTVDVPGDPVVPDATVIRASMSVDFTLRRETAFAWADPP